MSTPSEVLNIRYSGVFLSRSKNLKIISEEKGDVVGQNYSSFSALLNIGTINPVVLVALVRGDGPSGGSLLEELNWESLHVRSYASWDELVSAGVDLKDTEAQKLQPMPADAVTDFKIRAVAETETSKIYQFEQASHGRVTVFTSKPVISTGGNNLPRKTTFLPVLPGANFVYERS